MNRFMRFYNTNRKRFWLIVIIAIIVINTPRLLNEYIKNRNERLNNNTITNVSVGDNRNISNNPAIAGSKIDKQTNIETVNIIDEFIEYCNKKETEKAYNLLSNDCKENLFPSIEVFEERYINGFFQQSKSYNIETWISTITSITYKIELIEDMLATGKSSDFNIVDYYTVVNTEEGKKLNINNYIGKKLIYMESTVSDIKFKILEKNIYTDYVIYKISVQNSSRNTIMIDSKEKNRTVSIVGENGQDYFAFLNEITTSDLTILPGLTQEIEIKFNKLYNPEYIEKSMKFNDIILDANNKEQRTNIKIDIE